MLRAACAGLALWAAPAQGDAPDEDVEAIVVARPAEPLEIAGQTVEPGSVRRIDLEASESFAGAPVSIPVTVLHGRSAGPVLCLAGGVHGDEINGVEVVRRAIEAIDVETLQGSVVAVPIVNLHGFRRGSRYLPDRRDLNRYFPGRSRGSAASRVAHAVFEGVIRGCDQLLDFHTGSFQRANLPHVRGDLAQPSVRDLVDGLDGWLVLDHPGATGTLRRSATDAGIAAVTFEVGGPYRIEPEAVEAGLQGVQTLLGRLGTGGAGAPGQPVVARRSHWVRVDDGGLLFTHVEIGSAVGAGELLGVVIDPLSSQRSEVRAPAQGRVIGMAWSQVVIPGFAAFHLALSGEGQPGADGSEAAEEPGSELAPMELDERPE